MRAIIKPVSPPESAADGGSDARRDLEQAARSSVAIPVWLEEIIMPAGCEHDANVASEAGHLVDTAGTNASTRLSRNTETVSRKSDVQLESPDQALVTQVISDRDDTYGGLLVFLLCQVKTTKATCFSVTISAS